MRRFGLHAAALAVAALAFPAAASAATWSLQTTPNPAGADASGFADVSCSAANACAGVGSSVDATSGVQSALAARWNGSAWALQTLAAPAGSTGTDLTGVSCPSSTGCVAVGSYLDSVGDARTLAEAWNGTRWSVQSTPNPAGSLGSYLADVACTATNACTAVGTFVDSLGTQQPLAMRWNGTSWAIQTTPAPAGATASWLSSVSCTSSIACTAVGTSVDSAGARLTLAMSWNGTRWTIAATPNPAGAVASFLTGVSCTSSSACTAVGLWSDASGDYRPLALRWNGAAWSSQTVAAPVGATGSALNGVSCASATACTAVGYSYAAGGVATTLAEGWNGATWSVQATPNPAGSVAGVLAGVACTSSVVCHGLGHSTDGAGVRTTLGVRYF